MLEFIHIDVFGAITAARKFVICNAFIVSFSRAMWHPAARGTQAQVPTSDFTDYHEPPFDAIKSEVLMAASVQTRESIIK